jgi:histidyl-tRNA synthetase
MVIELRRAGVATDLAFGVKSIKNAMKSANRSGARFALIAGDRDLADGVVQLKNMTTGEQTPVALEALVSTLKEKQL